MGRDGTVVYTGSCGKSFHVICAKKSLNYDLSQGEVSVRCDVCAMHRSTVTPRTPGTSPDRSFSLGQSSDRRITLEDLMYQLQQSSASTNKKLESIKKSTDDKLELIYKSLTGLEENSNIIISGDLNCNLCSSNFEATLLKELTSSRALSIVASGPMHHTASAYSWLDVFIVDSPIRLFPSVSSMSLLLLVMIC